MSENDKTLLKRLNKLNIGIYAKVDILKKYNAGYKQGMLKLVKWLV